MMLLAWLFRVALANDRAPQPIASLSKYDPSLNSLNDYIPKHQDDSLRLMTMDCSENKISASDVMSLLESTQPDLAALIKYPRTPEEMTSIQGLLNLKSYSTIWVKPYGQEKGEILVLSKHPIQEFDRISLGEKRELIGSDITVKIGEKRFRFLPFSLDEFDSSKRVAGAMEVLYRAGAAVAKQDHYVILGATNSPTTKDGAIEKLRINPLLKDPFDVLKWPRPKFTSSGNTASDQVFVGHNLARHVQGAYVYYTGLSKHLPLIVDIAKSAFAAVPVPDNRYTWAHFSKDLYRLTIFWVPIIAIGTILIVLLAIFMKRREKNTDNHLSDEQGESAIWDTIDVSEKNPSERKERQATFDSMHSSTSSVYPPTVVRIQTPPTYPPPAYSIDPKK